MKAKFLCIVLILLFSVSAFAQNNTSPVLDRLEDDFKKYLLTPEYSAWLKEKNITADSVLKSVHETAVYFEPGIWRDSVNSILKQYVAKTNVSKALQTYAVFSLLNSSLNIISVPAAKAVDKIYFDLLFKDENEFEELLFADGALDYAMDLLDSYVEVMKNNHDILRTHPAYKNYYYASGARRIINDSLKLGTGKKYFLFESGKVQIIRHLHFAKQDGPEKGFYESGKPEYESFYKNGLRDGKSTGWYETGEKQYEGNYIAGTGKVVNYYRNGNIKFERSFKENKQDGPEKGFYESGKPEYESFYKNGLQDGKAIYWYETGEKEGEGNYTAGTGTHANYYRSGKVEFERSYKDGKKDGVEKAYYE
ncbi:MAG: toxin-antitoxin system YwqK family antitoxin, partial [Prevotellaceae bacterium]|nr:toxin-antitoxin system YwqK family antitoxin [Prevotellaceae bacterium]